MNVVYITTLVSIVILLPFVISIKKCPVDVIEGCQCINDAVICDGGYKGDDIPAFSNSYEVYRTVSII